MTAALVALTDQARAANGDALAHHLDLCRVIGQDANAPVGPVGMQVARRLVELLASEALSLCQHIGFRAPAPAMWNPVLGDRLCCPDCFTLRMQRVRHVELIRCTGCRAPSPQAVQHSFVVPATVEGDRVMPPVVVPYRLCARCEHVDQTSTPGPALEGS